MDTKTKEAIAVAQALSHLGKASRMQRAPTTSPAHAAYTAELIAAEVSAAHRVLSEVVGKAKP